MDTIKTPVSGNDTIELVGQAYVNTALFFLTGLALSGLLLEVIILSKLGAGIISLISLLIFAIVFGVLLRKFWKSMATAYIRGEMVIVKYLNGDIRITELKHVKMCKSFKFMKLGISNLKFRVDGKQHRVLLFGIPFTRKNIFSLPQKVA